MTGSVPSFLAHKQGDAVAVAVRDVSPGEAEVGFLDGSGTDTVTVKADVPLGHKVALADVAEGAEVVEYGLPIGRASVAIGRGDYVHTHNVRSIRWQTSVA